MLALIFILSFSSAAFADEDDDYTYATTPMKYLKSYKDWEKVRDEYAPISGDLRQDILSVARSQIGNCEDPENFKYVEEYGKKNWTLYGDFMGWPYCEWCDAFASFCAYYGGAGDYPLEVSCARHEIALKKAGYWRDWNQYIPKPGDLVFFTWNEDGYGVSHAGVVEKVVAKRGDKKAYLVTIEGNVGIQDGNGCSGVARCVRSFDNVVGYGTYEVGEPMEAKYTPHKSTNPGGERNDAYSQTSVPVKDVLVFLGYTDTPYYYYWFPEEKLLQITATQGGEGVKSTPEPVVQETPAPVEPTPVADSESENPAEHKDSSTEPAPLPPVKRKDKKFPELLDSIGLVPSEMNMSFKVDIE